MSSNFAQRYISLTPEHLTGGNPRSYGTASLGSGSEVFGEVDDESFAHMFDLMTRGDMSRYGAAKSMTGKEYSEGGMNLVAQPDDFCGYLLYAAFGDNATGQSVKYTLAGNVHTFKEGANHILPSFRIRVGREDNEHLYTGMCLSRLSVSASVNEYVTMSADFSGKAEGGLDALQTSVTYSGASADGLHFADGTINFSLDGDATNTASALIKSISFEISTNLNTDDACSIGSQTYSRQPEPQMREITGSVEFSRPVMAAVAGTDEPSYAQMIASDGLLYDGDDAQPAITLQFDSAGSGQMVFKIFKCRWEAPSLNVSGRDSSTMSCNFVALYDDGEEGMMSAALTTAATTVGRYSTI